ncbi:conserved hypothetical protein [Desulfamplus magnetovallimortis]|uniref:1,4-dihydroxy-6-naphtoate synthase n=1 Tax=Desulfamplus magnetovallimortis TaxID=1246637 RepID=A0A1W1HL48_9BACT|nr:1,4-dihydroxy-6-naphthoate synthase [Desulfamplus magnetovallimortis]SLM33183.1 conserved hypothetical protein [Desulfamplus magnetovallimortis]
MKKDLTLAYSTCPNDTYIFHAIADGLLPCNFNFDITLADVETLNQNGQKGKFDISKLSFAAFGFMQDKYALLRTGAALGRGCGPLLVGLPGKSLDSSSDNTIQLINCPSKEKIIKPVIAVPGMGTTAFVLLRLFLNDHFPHLQPEIIPMPFEKVMPSVIKKEADFGLIIHESRFVYKEMGLNSLVDLGNWWEEKTGLPIPLGCIAIKRELGKETAKAIENLTGQSIDYARQHPEAGTDYIKKHAQELNSEVIQAHIELYVNEFSRDIGEEGEAAIHAFYENARKAEIIPQSSLPLFAC